VTDCDAPEPPETWLCMYALESNGEATSCTCATYQCTSFLDGPCLCGFGGGSTNGSVTVCPMSTGDDAGVGAVSCCATTDPAWPGTDSCVCWDEPCGDGQIEVPTCSFVPPAETPMPANSGTTCAGLTWAAPAVAPDSGD
jgi:hypothetical protein